MATWCVPCVRALPKLDSLQKQFSGQTSILLVTKESQEEVHSLFKNMKSLKNVSLVSLTGDTLLHNKFQVGVYPHYVWIDSNRIIKAITSGDELTKENIKKLINNEALNMMD